MFKLDLEQTKNEIKDMTIKEKNVFLEKLQENLDEASTAISDLQESINDEYQDSINQQISDAIQVLIADKQWQDKVSIDKHNYILKTEGTIQAWIGLCYQRAFHQNTWTISIQSELSKLAESFPKLANKYGLNDKNGLATITIDIEETEILPTLERLISGWCNNE